MPAAQPSRKISKANEKAIDLMLRALTNRKKLLQFLDDMSLRRGVKLPEYRDMPDHMLRNLAAYCCVEKVYVKPPVKKKKVRRRSAYQ